MGQFGAGWCGALPVQSAVWIYSADCLASGSPNTKVPPCMMEGSGQKSPGANARGELEPRAERRAAGVARLGSFRTGGLGVGAFGRPPVSIPGVRELVRKSRVGGNGQGQTGLADLRASPGCTWAAETTRGLTPQ